MSSTEVTASEQLQPTPSTAVVSGKRQRDESQVTDRSATEVVEGTSTEDEPLSKKIRTVELQVEDEVGTSQEAFEDTAADGAGDDQLEEEEEGKEEFDFDGYDGEEGEEEEDQETQDTGRQEVIQATTIEPEVVLIESDEDEDVEEENLDEGEEEEDDEDYVEQDEDYAEGEVGEMEEDDEGEDEEAEYMEGEVVDEDDEDMDENGEDDPKQEVVEVIDDDEDDMDENAREAAAIEERQMGEEDAGEIVGEEDVAEEIQDQNEIEQAETSDANVEREISTTEQLTTGAAVDSQLLEGAQRSVTPTTSVTITQRLLSARSHLPPFSFPQGQPAPGPFNEEEDCMVPSTPTLYVPKRTDGFAEAISSPQINRSSFSFAAPGESSMSSVGVLELGMSEEGLRVDDTQVDLMGGSDEASHERPSFVVPTGLPEAVEASTASQSNQRIPSTSSDTRQLSLESLESETEAGSIATVPAIMVTPVTEVSEESSEQNVPVSQAHPEVLDTEVVELLEDVEALKEGEETEEQEAVEKGSELEMKESQEFASEDISQPSISGEPSRTSAQSASTTGGSAAKARQDLSRGRGSVVQLRRPATTSTWSTTRGGTQAQRGTSASGRVRRLRRDPVRGPGAHRGRGTQMPRGRQGGTPRGGGQA